MLILELNFMFILSMSPSDTEAHRPVESNEAGTLPSLPCLPLHCFHSFSLTGRQRPGPAARQAKGWAGHRVLSLSVNDM